MAPVRKYPVGIQSFESIRADGYVYVDKTPLIYKMITEGKPYFLSRPRRFGKSLLCSTLEAVFLGRRELFETFTTEDGIEQPQLYIATTDWKWHAHAVLRFDFSVGTEYTLEALDELTKSTLSQYEKLYGITHPAKGNNLRFMDLVLEAHRQTGRRVVVLVDEYDNFMLHSIGDQELEKAVRTHFSNLFSPIKRLDDHLQFVFITGISKFSQMGIFSTINNLKKISMQSDYEALCGVTEAELTTVLRPDIERLSTRLGKTYDETFAELKHTYDGYHFSEDITDIYNPFSLFNAFSAGKIKDYWFDSATPRVLIDMLAKMPPITLSDLEHVICPEGDFDMPFDSYQKPMPVLYQTGYLTIKDYDRDLEEYELGFPNAEVRKGFANCLYQMLTDVAGIDTNKNALLRAYKIFRRDDDLPVFIEAIKTFFAGIPYQLAERDGEGKQRKERKPERHYHVILYTLLSAFGADIRAEESTAKGRTDIVLGMPKHIYVMELKVDDSTASALTQIEERGYADKYLADGRPVVKVGIAFSSQERNITEYIVHTT